ncbi:GNAT family N-acetyltransferase [Halobacillus mangrovi]|uniref:GNAT family N-acetyltransferase n=1 Tax=Halobacillus mangrovi TaxID=402384 RepID=A0A1W5ZS95_9BACI|nr:GNAT family N-acetyltransferase [Halobacillus mangrovi]ARI76190.1 GNAT family N-acetyltransferase [Halobacillus mangrovi]
MTIRRYQQGDEAQIQSLFHKTFHTERGQNVWRWKFIENPKQERPFILVWDEDGQILGHISLWVSDAYINGEKKKVGLRVDTMVDPDARGKGIYKQLNKALLEEAKADDIAYLYGFPAPKAKELFVRYTEATHLTDMPRYVFIQHPVALLASKLAPLKLFKPLDGVFEKLKRPSFSSDKRLQVKKVTHCDERFDELAKKTSTQEEAALIRDADYLNWRYHDHPVNKYTMAAVYDHDELKGYVVTKLTEGKFKNGLIIDWLAVDEDSVWETLLEAAFHHLSEADLIQSWQLSHTIGAEVLKKHNFTHKDSPMPLVGKEVVPDTAFMNDVKSWMITMGDVDSF